MTTYKRGKYFAYDDVLRAGSQKRVTKPQDHLREARRKVLLKRFLGRRNKKKEKNEASFLFVECIKRRLSV